MPISVPRRRLTLAGAATLGLAACAGWQSHAPERGPIAAMFPGRIDDGGFMEAGYGGLLRIRDELGIPVQHVEQVAADEKPMREALRELAGSDAKMVIAYGSEAAEAVQRVAWEFPAQRFTSVQGSLLRPNLAVYAVRLEQSTWLAGAAAGLLTRSDVVGHVCGRRDPFGLKARAAFAAGLAHTNPKAKLLTSFVGADDDVEAAKRITLAEIDAGADVVHTTLGAGRAGAVEASRERGVKLIGNVARWVPSMADIFVAGAVADPGVAVFQSGRDLFDNLWKGDVTRRFGVRNPDAVGLVFAPSVAEAVRARITVATQELAAGSIKIPEEYRGPEFLS